MGFKDSEVVVDDLDSEEMQDLKMGLINYAYCQYSQLKSVPQVTVPRVTKYRSPGNSSPGYQIPFPR